MCGPLLESTPVLFGAKAPSRTCGDSTSIAALMLNHHPDLNAGTPDRGIFSPKICRVKLKSYGQLCRDSKGFCQCRP